MFHVCDDIERDGQGEGESHHVYSATRPGRGHPETGQRTGVPEAEQHEIDDLRRLRINFLVPRVPASKRIGMRPAGNRRWPRSIDLPWLRQLHAADTRKLG